MAKEVAWYNICTVAFSETRLSDKMKINRQKQVLDTQIFWMGKQKSESQVECSEFAIRTVLT